MISSKTNFMYELPDEFPKNYLKKLDNVKKFSILVRSHSPVPNLSCSSTKDYTKANMKLYNSCGVLVNFFTLAQIHFFEHCKSSFLSIFRACA